MKSIIKTFMFAALMLAASVTAQAQVLSTHVETGDVEGVLDDGLAVYKAIPYAAPPVGNLRWRAPQPALPWQGVRKCDEFGPMPPQPTRPGRTADMMNEDCLYLGIATPAKSKAEKLPVMVWIHGGGFQTEWYGGDLWKQLALRGVVIVSVEYRTGALGFMAHPELSKEDKEGHSGNYGLLDQIFALKWVQRNIKNFGGDPSKVTIFGESAGAFSCHILCASPLAKGLFRACISQSGGYISPMNNINKELGQMLGSMFMNQLQKKNIAEMRQMDAKSLTGNNVNFPGGGPIIDGYVIPEHIYSIYQKGTYNDIPVLIMHNSDEGAVDYDSVSEETYNQLLKQLPANWSDSVRAQYPGNTPEERLYSMRDITRDISFGWPSYTWATLQKKTGKSPVYMAYLAQKSDTTVYAKGNRRGAAHADDMMYLKGAFDNKADRFPQEKKVGELMQQYWVNFAKTGGNPNGKGLPKWPEFDEQQPTVMQFNNGASLIPVPNKSKISVIDGFFKSMLPTSQKD